VSSGQIMSVSNWEEGVVAANFGLSQAGSAPAMDRVRAALRIVYPIVITVTLVLLSVSSVGAQVSVSVSDSTFAFGTNLLNTWLTPQTSVIINDGAAAENFLGRISQFTDGSNTWGISESANGDDTTRAQWSTTSQDGPWTDISAYDTDFTIATNVAVSDSLTFWFRIQTPVGTSSYDEHSSTLTVTAQEY
jgi:hypothetical protein